jgi:transaldolase
MPPKVLEQMYDHMLTDKGMEIFEKDWSEVKGE